MAAEGVTPDEPAEATAEPVTPATVDGQAEAERKLGGIEAMARAYVDTLPFGASDPRRLIGELAVALARKLDDDRGAAPPAVRELRTMLMQLTEVPNETAGVVDEIRLRQNMRRLDAILANVEKGMVVPSVGVEE